MDAARVSQKHEWPLGGRCPNAGSTWSASFLEAWGGLARPLLCRVPWLRDLFQLNFAQHPLSSHCWWPTPQALAPDVPSLVTRPFRQMKVLSTWLKSNFFWRIHLSGRIPHTVMALWMGQWFFFTKRKGKEVKSNRKKKKYKIEQNYQKQPFQGTRHPHCKLSS